MHTHTETRQGAGTQAILLQLLNLRSNASPNFKGIPQRTGRSRGLRKGGAAAGERLVSPPPGALKLGARRVSLGGAPLCRQAARQAQQRKARGRVLCQVLPERLQRALHHCKGPHAQRTCSLSNHKNVAIEFCLRTRLYSLESRRQ